MGLPKVLMRRPLVTLSAGAVILILPVIVFVIVFSITRARRRTGSVSGIPADVPDFVVKYAPLLYLYSEDPYLPSDIGTQLAHTTPKLNASDLPSTPAFGKATLDNLNQLNQFGRGGLDVYLTSNDDVTTNPPWLGGIKPSSNGVVPNAKTCAVIVAEKGNNTVDAFFMYFYAFNYGGITLGDNLGNHVGDWENSMVRFINGKPKYVWYSQHSSGQVFTYDVVEKDKTGLRPIVFSANGSHANYAIEGIHDYTSASEHTNKSGLLNDYTDRGPLYDPIHSSYWYKWGKGSGDGANSSSVPFADTAKRGIFTPYDSSYPTGWLYFEGRWGDEQYPDSDKRQSNLAGEFFKWESGPTGPEDKDIGRTVVTSGSNTEILTKLGP